MGKGVNVGGGLSFEQMVNAFTRALENASGGGGGGGSETFPDAVVTGTGGYVIPAGFNAIVRVQVANGGNFTINGSSALESNDFDIQRKVQDPSGTFSGSTVVTVGSRRIGRYAVFTRTQSASGSSSSNVEGHPYAYNYMGGGNATPDSPSAWVLGPGGTVSTSFSQSPRYRIAGVEHGRQNTTAFQTFKVPEGTTISGGNSRIVELYAI